MIVLEQNPLALYALFSEGPAMWLVCATFLWLSVHVRSLLALRDKSGAKRTTNEWAESAEERKREGSE